MHKDEIARALDLANPEVSLVGIIDDATGILFERQLESVLSLVRDCRSGILFLTPWRNPPTSGIRFDGEVYSFVCSPSLLTSILEVQPISIESAAYSILQAVLSRRVRVDRLIVRQLGQPLVENRISMPDAAVIMAHRGEASHLECALESIRRMASRGLVKAFVGIDEDAGPYGGLCARYPEVCFYYVPPPSLGHFYIKQSLAEMCGESFMAFHDSDDVSCDDRIAVTLAEIARTKSDVVGCHELRMDEVNQKVEVYRLPLDVSKALEIEQRGAQLHATTVVNRKRFLQIGGLSTHQRIGNDTQFRLRAFFSLKMRNVDAFLYVRRRHAQSLTMTPETALGCPLRRELRRSWEGAFSAIRRGQLRIEDSSLQPVRTAFGAPLIRI